MPVSLPTSLICGFLGAGKTTLINRLINSPSGERLGILVNDFGALNIDSDLIDARTESKIALSNGCICCSIQDDFAAAIVRMCESGDALSRLVVECSGVSHPAGFLSAFDSPRVAACAHVDGVFCVVDTVGFMDLDYPSTELAIDQAAMSDLVLLNKMDMASDTAATDVERVLLGAQPHMRLLRVANASLPATVLIGPRAGARRSSVRHPTDHRHDDVFDTWSYVSETTIELQDFQALDAALPVGILRAKGLLRIRSPRNGSAERAVYQRVGKRADLACDQRQPPALSELVFIARAGDVDRAAMRTALAHCPGFVPFGQDAGGRPKDVLAVS